MWAIDAGSGSARRIGRPEWRGVKLVTGLSGVGYAIERSTLFSVDLKTGVYTQLGRPGDWRRATGLCGSGSFLYAVEATRLYRIAPTGAYRTLGQPNDWPGEVMMAGLDGLLVNWWRNGVYAVDIQTGDWALLGDTSEWNGAQAITGYDRTVYVAVRSELWTVDAHTGQSAQLGAAGWEGDILLAACKEGLFVINHEDLFWVNPVSGESKRLSRDRAWSHTSFLAAL